MLGILGGTFDPIHYGHLSAAWHAYQTLELNELRFMPCNHPPHRQAPIADAAHRIAMLKLAIKDIPGFTLDDRELKTNEISYTVNSLSAVKEEVKDTPICLLLGYDAFSQIATWHNPDTLIKLAHIIILDRPEKIINQNDFIDKLLTTEVKDPKKLKQQNAGLVYFASNPLLCISSTLIRQILGQKLKPRFLLPEPVLNYMAEKKLYR